MQRTSLDLREKAGLPSGQAKDMVEAVEIELTARLNELATKNDLTTAVASVRAEMAEIRHDLQTQIHVLRADGARWAVGIVFSLIGAGGVGLGILYFFLTYVRK